MTMKSIQIFVLAGVFLLQYVLEHWRPQRKEINNWKRERVNIGIGLLNIALTFVPAGLLVQGLSFIETHRLGLLQQFALPLGVQVVCTLLVMDFWMYAWHRFNHTVPWLWRFHRFHHRDTHLNTTTALRFHVIELFLSYPGKALVCFLFGISYLPLLLYEIVFFASVIIHHSNVYITEKVDAVYRLLFASPLMHRVHHSVRKEETDSNFGALFSFWDRLLGSWSRPREGVEFGLPPEGSGGTGASRQGSSRATNARQ